MNRRLIRSRMKELGLSHRDLSVAIGCTPTYISNLLSVNLRPRRPSPPVARRLARRLRLRLLEIFPNGV